MPRLKRPVSLRSSSLLVVVRTVMSNCRRKHLSELQSWRCHPFYPFSSLINWYNSGDPTWADQLRENVPAFLANDYMEMVLMVANRIWDRSWELRDAFHPDCTRVDTLGMDLDYHLETYLGRNLDVMPRLTDIHLPILTCVKDNVPVLTKLRSVKFSVASQGVINALAYNCPDLVSVVDIHADFSRPISIAGLTACRNLRVIILSQQLVASEVIQVLDSLPALQVMHISNISDVLRVCQRSYHIRDFCGLLCQSELLEKLTRHFPDLTSLRYYEANSIPVMNVPDETVHDREARGDDDSLGVIGQLRHLTKLVVAPRNDDRLLDLLGTFGRLSHLGFQQAYRLGSVLGTLTFPRLTNLDLSYCGEVDMVSVLNAFPGLVSLKMCSCILSDLPRFGRCCANLRNLDKLEMIHCIRLSVPHLCYLLSTCMDLRHLKIGSPMVNNQVLTQLLKVNPMRNLRTLCLLECQLTKDVIPVILESFGELRDVMLDGPLLDLEVTYDIWDEMMDELDKYRVKFVVGFDGQEFHYDGYQL